MSSHDRAAQFAPFAALTGYEEMVAETGRLTGDQVELDEMQAYRLDCAMQEVLTRLNERPSVRIRYFVHDRRKKGGVYKSLEGRVRNVDFEKRTLVLTDDTSIPLRDMLEMTVLG